MRKSAPKFDHDSPIEGHEGSNRRGLLKGAALLGGAAAIPYWKTPIVRSVILPAHAQTSGFACNIEIDPQNASDSILVTVTPPPPYPPGGLIRTTLTLNTSNIGDPSDSVERPTDDNGQVSFSFDDFDLGDTSGAAVESVAIQSTCANPEECDASCELVLTEEDINPRPD